MEKQINDKLDALLKYLPFIDLILKIDKNKYYKFIEIRKWISSKKRYPLSDLNKIEQSLITQYKNLLLVDQKIPREIMKIFRGDIKHQFVNLCSDDEDDNNKIKENTKKDKSKQEEYKSRKVEEKLKDVQDKIKLLEDKRKINADVEKKYSESKKLKDKSSKKSSSNSIKDKQINHYDSDDDLEIVSVVYIEKTQQLSKNDVTTKATKDSKSLEKEKISTKNDLEIDDASAELLRKIDVLQEDDKKNKNLHEPINYLKYSDDDDENETVIVEDKLFQRRKSEDLLFKRREDFKNERTTNVQEKEITTKEDKKHKKHKRRSSNKSPTTIIETISLDSTASESEESLSNEPSTSAKAVAALKKYSGLKENVTIGPNTISVQDGTSTIDINSPPVIIENNIKNSNTVKENQTCVDDGIPSIITSDRVISARKITIDVIQDVNSNENNSSSHTVINNDSNDGFSMDILEMDVDTENDLEYVLNEIRNPEDTQNQIASVQCDTTPRNGRNPSPPLLASSATTLENNDINKSKNNKENLPVSSGHKEDYTGLTYDDIINICEEIKNKSDIELDKHLQNLWAVYENTPSGTIENQRASNAQNDITPSPPHLNSTVVSPQQPPAPPLSLQQPPIPPLPSQQSAAPPLPLQQPPIPPLPSQQSAAPPLPLSWMPPGHPTYPQQIYQPQQFNGLLTGMPMQRISLKDPRLIREVDRLNNSPLFLQLLRHIGLNISNITPHTSHQQQSYITPSNYPVPPQHLPSTKTTSVRPPVSAASNKPRHNSSSTTASTITFGEYKRRQQQEELNRKRDEENRRLEEIKRKKDEENRLKEEIRKKQEAEAKEVERRKFEEERDDIRSKILTTIEPHIDELVPLWEKQKSLLSSSGTTQPKKINSRRSSTKPTSSAADTEDKNKNKKSGPVKSSDDKINRVHKVLECTVKGFDQLQDYVPKTIGGKRRSSISASLAISEQLNSCSDQSDANSCSQPKKPISDGVGQVNKRRSSISARSAIRNQLHDSSDLSDINSSESSSDILKENLSSKPISKRRSSVRITNNSESSNDLISAQTNAGMPKLIPCINSSPSTENSYTMTTGGKRKSSLSARLAISEQLQQHQPNNNSDYYDDSDNNISSQQSITSGRRNSVCVTKRRKTIDESNQPIEKVKLQIIRDFSDSSSGEEADFVKFRSAKMKRLKEEIIKNQPFVTLDRISEDFIKKHTRRRRDNEKTVLNLLDERYCVTDKTPLTQPSVLKQKRPNNDCQMTENNTKNCVLCSSKPSDLTNHYVRKHKTESYVSRLAWSTIDDIDINPPFAKLQPKNGNSRIDIYKVECPFCTEQLVEPFMNLYNHYSTHTGEFAYECAHCTLSKPFREDIRSHQLHSKTCRKSYIKTIYQYPTNGQCIYLYCCEICNFVQINEANVLKHQREHHDPRKPVKVNKLILAVKNDAPEVEEKPTEEREGGEKEEETKAKEQQNEIRADVNNREIEVTTTCNTTDIKKHELDFKVDDDDIPVNNEACSEDVFEGGTFSLEEQLKQMHAEPPTNHNTTTMTVIHSEATSSNNIQSSASHHLPISPKKEAKHIPMIMKDEPMDIDVSHLITPPRSSASSTAAAEAVAGIIANDSQEIEAIIENENLLSHISAETATSATSTTILNENNTQMQANILQDNINIVAQFSKSYTVYEKYRTYPSNVKYMGLYKCMADDCYYSTDSCEEMLTHLNDHSQEYYPIEYLHCPYCTISESNVQISPLQLVQHIQIQHQHMIYQCWMCCYRSCEPSNVSVHQQLCHSDVDKQNFLIFKCSGPEVGHNEKQEYINKKVYENVRKICCPYCSKACFYSSKHIIKHINEHHRIRDADGLKVFSCIYCPLTDKDHNCIHKHVSTKHPEELPYFYDHNAATGVQDTLSNLYLLNVSQPVDCVEVKSLDSGGDGDGAAAEQLPQDDIKPDLNELLKMNEETVKIRLGKLTTHTGIAPDTLYRCPLSTCGGFFSNYDLWLRHMKVRHRSLECQCPHCPVTIENGRAVSVMRTLESYVIHFEEHRRHTYICFYCSTTCPNEDVAKKHATEEHRRNIEDLRFEKIHFNINYSYFVMIEMGLYREREEFLTELLAILDRRLSDLEIIEVGKLKRQWLVDNSALWLENIPKFFAKRRVLKKCLTKTCTFRSMDDEAIFSHLKENHAINSSKEYFTCNKCQVKIICNDWDNILDHSRLHSENKIFICVACSLTYSEPSKLSEHIRQEHAARHGSPEPGKSRPKVYPKSSGDPCRDVPVIELIRDSETDATYIKLAIVFANNQLTFSTIKNCFCCTEKSMSGDALNLHLRRYHKLILNYFCECCINTQFKTLEEVKPHFQHFHPTANVKIRCTLAANNELRIISLNEFQLQIGNEVKPLVEIKKEAADSDDDSVILLEDDDIVIQDSLKEQQLAGEREKPKLKCIALSNLLDTQNLTTTPITAKTPLSSPPIIRVVPSAKIVKIGNVANGNATTPVSSTSDNQNNVQLRKLLTNATTPVSSTSDNQNNVQLRQLLTNNSTPLQIPSVNNSNLPTTSTSNPIMSTSRTQTNVAPSTSSSHRPTSINPNYIGSNLGNQNSTNISNNQIYSCPIPSIITQNHTRAAPRMKNNPNFHSRDFNAPPNTNNYAAHNVNTPNYYHEPYPNHGPRPNSHNYNITQPYTHNFNNNVHNHNYSNVSSFNVPNCTRITPLPNGLHNNGQPR